MRTQARDPKRKFKAIYNKDEYEQAVRSAYRLGVLDGEQRRKETLRAMQTANKHLVAELVRLDRDEPLDSLALPFSLIDQIEQALIEHKERYILGLLRKYTKAETAGDIDAIQSRIDSK